MNQPTITTKPISDRLTRERTFEVPNLRGDGKDARAYVIFTLDQILAEKVTGRIVINCSQGGIVNIKVEQQERVPA